MSFPLHSDSAAELALIFVTAVGGGAFAFVLVYWIWLRGFARRVIELQDTVVALASALSPGMAKSKPPSFYDVDEAPSAMPGAGPVRDGAVRMLVEGRDIEIVTAEGREEIRIEETPERPLTPQERDRIIAYLRYEGFLP